jgi:hypothetical protein
LRSGPTKKRPNDADTVKISGNQKKFRVNQENMTYEQPFCPENKMVRRLITMLQKETEK